MRQGKYLGLNLPDYTDAADVQKLVENFEKLEERAPGWTNLSNSGTVLETGGSFQVAPLFPVGDAGIFAITLKMPRAFVEGDVVMVEDTAYNLYQGSDPADSEAFKAGEVVTLNFDKAARKCWAASGAGTPKPLPAQISNLQGVAQEGESPSIVWTWTNPVDENFAGMVLVVKEGSAPNGVTDGVQVYKGSATTVTQSEGLQFERTYYARGYAYNSQNKYQMDATGAIASVELSAVPDQVSDVVLTPNKSQATLSWTNPVSTNLQTVKVIQKIGSAPENPNDGTQVYEGTGTTVTVENLQDSIEYYFAVFAIGKNGKYKDPVVKNYTPAFLPRYSYTGDHQLIKDENNHWRIKFLSSGVLEWISDDAQIDVFLVGGGGSGSAGGGGGGYTQTHKKQILEKNQMVQIYVGAGGEDGSGGTSYYGNLYAQGGTSTHSNGIGGDGGSGGGGGERGSDPYNPSGTAGRGGSDGGNGEDLSSYSYGGRGQGRTTREFGEPEGALYSGGGGGRDLYGGAPGGEGTPVIAAHGASAGNLRGGGPGGGYGGGGGGSSSGKSKGAQGIVIIRDARA